MAAFLAVCLSLALYVLPAFVAYQRDHQSKGAILALDVLLGWTALGWIVALVWALTDTARRVEIATEAAPAAPARKPSRDTVFAASPSEWTAECPACRSRVHPEAMICPSCRSALR